MRPPSFLVVLVLTPPALVAQELASNDLEQLARQYIASVGAMDYSTERRFYDEDSTFEDPTSAQFGEPWHYQGPEAIISFFRGINEEYGTLAIDNQIQKLLVSPPFVVAFITATVTSCGVILDQPKKAWSGSIEMVMALEFDGSIVRSRTAWADYPSSALKLQEIAKTLPDQDDDPRCQHLASP